MKSPQWLNMQAIVKRIQWKDAKVIIGGRRKQKLLFQEAIEIARHKTFNADTGMHIPAVWQDYLSREKSTAWKSLYSVDESHPDVVRASKRRGKRESTGPNGIRASRYDLRSYKRTTGLSVNQMHDDDATVKSSIELPNC